MFGNPETTTGGRALKFWSSVRLEVRRIETLKVSGEAVGTRVKVKVAKNKVGPPFKNAEFDIMFSQGISKSGGLLDVATDMGLVTKTGTWFTYGETRMGQGRENAKAYLENNPDLMADLEAKIRNGAATAVVNVGKDEVATKE